MFNLDIKNIDKNVVNLMKFGFKWSSITIIISLYMLVLYKLNPISHVLFESGLLLFKASLMYIVSFFICGLVIDQLIKKNI